MTREDVTFQSGGDEIAAWLYPGGSTCVVMAHGFSLTRHDGLDTYATALNQAGATVLVFDHRYLGDSGGEPRQRVRVKQQAEDYRAAVAYARQLDGVDPDQHRAVGLLVRRRHLGQRRCQRRAYRRRDAALPVP